MERFAKEKCLSVANNVSISLADNASISLNIPKYPWQCLNKLLRLCLGSQYTWSSFMFDTFLKMLQVLNMLNFWIWNCCICNGYTEFWICPIMAQYVTIMPEYVSMCLNDPKYARTCVNNDLSMAEYCLMSPNMFENTWVNCSDYSRVLNTPHHLRYFSICLRH